MMCFENPAVLALNEQLKQENERLHRENNALRYLKDNERTRRIEGRRTDAWVERLMLFSVTVFALSLAFCAGAALAL